jgi:hypothetical protein
MHPSNYYYQQLRAFMAEHHPWRLGAMSPDEQAAFLEERAARAAEAFETHRRAGGDVTGATEVAGQVLLGDLEFTPEALITRLVEESYPQYRHLLDESVAPGYAFQLLEECRPLLHRLYDPEGEPKVANAESGLRAALGRYLGKLIL